MEYVHIQMWLTCIVVVLLVHIQFMHCRLITVTFLKVLEALLIIMVIEMWSQIPEHIELFWNSTQDIIKQKLDL
jgi:hypothetical protein